ncbi:glycosyltransferase [Rhodococcus aetherivorans]|uniref:glycosyltransferase family A protein n=1 Tax=Rhodococcus aetherivorans TaxID=191292 RepID=UPI00210078BE|nr:glycosyltransferase family A protein [Rhodococcus aetherivorans]MDV6295448.1 glycosyltransferase family A protein [Rhodococcus aetherivorans]
MTAFVPVADVTATGLSILCLLLVPGYLLIEHRGIELLPLVLAAAGWISYLASCLVNGVAVLSPNVMAPAAFALYLIGLSVVVGRSVRAIATVLAGIAAGTVIFHLVRGIELTRTGSFLDLWKYGIAQSATILVLFVLVKAGVHRLALPSVLAALGLVSLVLNFRSHALICFVAAATVLTGWVLAPRIGRGWQYAVVFGFAGTFAVVMPSVARTGLLGPALQAKVLQQDSSGLPALFAGRPEPPLSLTAIYERPLLGWGDAQHLTPELYTSAAHLAIRLGYTPTLPFELYWRIPGDYSALHSIVLASWAEGGVAAVMLPLWLLGVCGALVWNSPRYGRWAPLVVVVAVQGIWDLLYSPWTYNLIPVYACIVLLFSARHFPGSVRAGREPARVARPPIQPVANGRDDGPAPDARVSVVIPTIGRPTLTRAVQSVLNQSCPVEEIVVVADTGAPLPVSSNDQIVVLGVGPNAGPGRCRQAGIDAARGTVIALLDDDDEWCADKLRRQLDAVAHRSDRSWIVSSRMAVVGPGDRRRIWPRRLVKVDQSVADYLFRFTGLTAGGAVLQASTLCFPVEIGRLIRWDADPDGVHDEPSWLMRAQREIEGLSIIQLADVLSTYHVSGESVSRTAHDRSGEYIAWGLEHLRGESPRVRGDYLCTSPVSAAVSARSVVGVWRSVQAAVRHGRPGPQALAYAGLGAVRIALLRGRAAARQVRTTMPLRRSR